MIEYKLLNKDNSPVTRDNYEDVSKIITDIFPVTPRDVNKMERSIRETYGVNGNAVHLYYGNKNTQVFVPQKDENMFKGKIESKGFKLEKIKCL